MGRSRDGFHVVELSCVVVDPADHHRGQFFPCLFDRAKHIVRAQEVLSFARGEFDEVFIGVASVQANLTAQGVAIAWEGFRFAQQLAPRALGLVKADEEQVQVDGEPVHGHHFMGLRARQVAQPFRETLVITDPRVLTLKVPFNAPLRPIVQLDFQRRLGGLGLEPEAVAREVHRIGTTVLRNVEALAKTAEGVRRVQFAGRLKCGKLSHAGLISH